MKNPYQFGTKEYYDFDLEHFKKTINKLNIVPYLVTAAGLVLIVGTILDACH